MDKPEQPRSKTKDFLNGMLQGAVIFPAIGATFKTDYLLERTATIGEAFKKNFATPKGIFINIIGGVVFGAIDLAINTVMGRYKEPPLPNPLPQPVAMIEATPSNSSHSFQEKEAARRDQSQAQGAHLG